MWAAFGNWLVGAIILPLLKDAAFMLVNFLKVRQLRKQKEAETAKKNEAYENNPTDDTFGSSP